MAGFHLKKQSLGAFYKFVGNALVKTGQPVEYGQPLFAIKAR